MNIFIISLSTTRIASLLGDKAYLYISDTAYLYISLTSSKFTERGIQVLLNILPSCVF